MDSSNRITGLSLFTGIGGLELALKEWVKPVAYCEIDPYAQAVLLSRMQTGDLEEAPIWDDVTTLEARMLPKIDIIYGGFPCHGLSTAGLGKGLADKRSGLFYEILRLSKEIRPTFIFLENVPAIRTRGLYTVTKELSDLRYDCRWGTVSAQEMGAPHKRERWFLLAYSNRKLLRKQPRGWSRASREKTTQPTVDGKKKSLAHSNLKLQGHVYTGETKIQSNKSKTDERKRDSLPNADYWDALSSIHRISNDVSYRLDRLRVIGNAVVCESAKEAFKRLMGLK